MSSLKERFYSLLRASERYTKTDMVYLSHNGFWVNANFAVFTLLAFLLSIVLANVLPKETYGTYQYLLSLFSILSGFTLTGMGTAITRAVARNMEGTVRSALRTQMRWALLVSIAALCGALYYFLTDDIQIAGGLVLVSVCLPLIAGYGSYQAYLTGKKDFRGLFFTGTLINVCYYGAVILAAFLFGDALWLFATNLIVSTVLTAFVYVRVTRAIAADAPKDSEANAYGAHLSVMNGLVRISGQIDTVLIYTLLGPVIVAEYALAKLIPERVGSVFKAQIATVLPRFATRTPREIRATLLHKMLLMSLAVGAVTSLYIFFAPLLFSLVYPQYESGVIYSQLLALTIIGALAHLPVTALMSQADERKLYAYNITFSLFQTAAQVLGILFYGLWGLIFARIAASAFSVLSAYVFASLPYASERTVAHSTE